jgi:hypothetical protein
MILSVDGESDTATITNFINNKFITRDTKSFREYIGKITPDINMEFDYENPTTGEMEKRPIPMGVGFFWPTE